MAIRLQGRLARILAFLVSLRDPRIFAVMTKRGFTKQDLDEGWALFTIAAGAKLRYKSSIPGTPSDAEANRALAALDAWENAWFPVVAATLERSFPALHTIVFQNLAQTEGRAVIVSVSTLLERTAKFKGETDGSKALALLKDRGFTPAVRKEAEELLELLKSQGEETIPEVEPQSGAERDKALQDVWAWYKEWSTIARTLFTRGDVLVRMGLRKAKRGAAPDDDAGNPESPPNEPEPGK